ncbi:cytochrome P450 18a1-like isoform X1 [Tachypleus tridentatus]|uniref:cytochrome P450 18a1-like isoform X1 n=1 Tax=Tachypleus tridentatus TaxID=6853 RepID=UPI003FD569ED
MSLFVNYTLQLIQFLQRYFPSSVTLFLVFFMVLFLTRLTFFCGSRLPLPPGPRGLPLLGSLPFLGRDFHLTLTSLARSYGPIYQMFLGGKRVVVLNEPQMVRQAFRQHVFSGRPDTELTKLLQGYGIINSSGALWREQRAFLHCIMRQFGAKNIGPGKAALETKVKDQVSEFLYGISKLNGTPYRPRSTIARAVSNVVGSLLMSVTYSKEDPRFTRLLELIEEGFRLLTLAVPVNFIPVLRYIPGGNYAYQKIKQNREETAAYFQEVAEEHKHTLDPQDLRDFVDAYLVQLQENQNDNKESYFSEMQLLQVMGDIFSAGLETVTSTLEWAILFLVRDLDIQTRVQEELDTVVGRNRLPSLADQRDLPYTEATILEVLRRANVIALGNAHATLEDTEFAGYHIPKDTHVLPNLWAIHMDPKLWSEPEVFKPERFLLDGKVSKPDFFMPFSVGRRVCLGDVLTKMELFLFLTGLLHQFNLRVPEGEEPPSTEGVVAVSLTPKPFHVCASQRNKTLLTV